MGNRMTEITTFALGALTGAVMLAISTTSHGAAQDPEAIAPEPTPAAAPARVLEPRVGFDFGADGSFESVAPVRVAAPRPPALDSVR